MITGELVNVVAECVKVPFLIFCTALIPCPQLSDSLPIDPPPTPPSLFQNKQNPLQKVILRTLIWCFFFKPCK